MRGLCHSGSVLGTFIAANGCGGYEDAVWISVRVTFISAVTAALGSSHGVAFQVL